jgi:two-component system, NarL family, sensor histidine kinase BarA
MSVSGRVLNIVLAAALPLPFFALYFAGGNPLFVVVGLITSVFGVGIAIAMGHNIKRRLQRIEDAVHQIGEGNFSVRIPESTGSDEIAALERALNTSVDLVAERRARFVELDTLKSDFVSSVSHELRTPLTTIKALTRLLIRNDLSEEKRQEYLQTISLECDRQIDLVLNLLDLSRIEGGVFRLAAEEVDVNEIIRSCVQAEARAAERRGHSLRMEPSSRVSTACADPKALRRVLNNLIENAIKYTPDGGSISLSAKDEGNLVYISVTDNGRGITEDDLPVLFEKFHRGRPAPHSAAMREATDDAVLLEDADVSGLGLGLYLSKNVMERMGGTISVKSTPGKGSTFTLGLLQWTARCAGYSQQEV